MTMGPADLRWKLEDAVTIALAAVGVLGVFVLDLLTPRGYAVWIGYGLPLWAGVPASDQNNRPASCHGARLHRIDRRGVCPGTPWN